MKSSLFVGTYPGLTKSMLDHEINLLKSYFHLFDACHFDHFLVYSSFFL